MAALRLLHLRGEAIFRRFDHDATTLDVSTETVRLATTEQARNTPSVDAATYAAWRDARGGAALVPCRRDGCAPEAVVLLRPDGRLEVDQGRGFSPWPPPSPAAPPPEAGGVRFGPATPPAPHKLAEPRALCRDPHGRLWLLERGARRVLLLAADDLRPLDVLRFPDGADLLHLATSGWAALAIDAGSPRLFVQPYGGEWTAISFAGAPPPAGARAVAAAGHGDRLAALYVLAAPQVWEPGQDPVHALVAVIDQPAAGAPAAARLIGLPSLEQPLPMLVLPGGDLLVGEVEGPPRSAMRFTRFSLTADGLLRTRATFGARGFDGLALYLNGDGEPTVTTARGPRRLYEVLEAPNRLEGRIETFALDSQRYGCAWHRVLLDVCLPPGAAIVVESRTSDDLLPEDLRRDPRPPAEGGRPEANVKKAFPLGSRTPLDVEGWLPVGSLDRRQALADVPFPPSSPEGTETLEGLIKNPPGRYLWLRVHLRGTKRRTPALASIRVTFPRPSVLALLPAFWRADPDAAREMDHLLSLFEGFLTELDGRIEALPELFNPRACPAEALDWLAGFVGLSLDARLPEDRRRALVREAAWLFERRGTAPGLSRLCAIIAGAQVDVIEAFRQRRRTGVILGARDAVAGPDLLLGREGPDAAEPWEAALLAQHGALMKARAAAGPGAPLCPAEDPPPPVDPDPLIAFYRRSAHRFTVVVFGDRDAAIEPVLLRAIEQNKPAHTLHELCWLEAGFRLGVSTYVGFGTRLGETSAAGFTPAILGESPLGAPTLISTPTTRRVLGTFIGAARVGDSTYQ
ncbi:phage tail protein [Sorangium sp. So ce1182]|uniref:phage tail protein n=1 Tax=Sorangium sp. So ce1182 TaxID=3133334 RepID=UPI003F6224E9